MREGVGVRGCVGRRGCDMMQITKGKGAGDMTYLGHGQVVSEKGWWYQRVCWYITKGDMTYLGHGQVVGEKG